MQVLSYLELTTEIKKCHNQILNVNVHQSIPISKIAPVAPVNKEPRSLTVKTLEIILLC